MAAACNAMMMFCLCVCDDGVNSGFVYVFAHVCVQWNLADIWFRPYLKLFAALYILIIILVYTRACESV